MVFTSTKVPKFAGVTSWEQYRQVLETIAQSNGWYDATAALQLLSHLEGDALNVALLVPEARQATCTGPVGALTLHYESPGQLADYRRQFEKTTRKEGEDPSIFGIALETLAAKAFGGMGHTARLRIIRDRFVAGHDSCALRRYLDSVPPETPIRDIVDCCRMWESHADTEARKPGPERALPIYTVDEPGCGLDDRMVAAVTVPPAVPDQLETLLRRLLPTLLGPASPPKPIPTELENLLQRLLEGVPAPKPTLPPKTGITDMETLLQRLLPGVPVADYRVGLGYGDVFLLWQVRARSGPVFRIE